LSSELLYSNVCVFFTLWSRHGKTCGPTHRITDCNQGAMCIGVAVLQLHQERGTHTYMPENRHICLTHIHLLQGAQHTCMYTVLCPHYHFVHMEGMCMFWQKPDVFIVRECSMAS
jgi:hypothetical protein